MSSYLVLGVEMPIHKAYLMLCDIDQNFKTHAVKTCREMLIKAKIIDEKTEDDVNILEIMKKEFEKDNDTVNEFVYD